MSIKFISFAEHVVPRIKIHLNKYIKLQSDSFIFSAAIPQTLPVASRNYDRTDVLIEIMMHVPYGTTPSSLYEQTLSVVTAEIPVSDTSSSPFC